MEKQKKKAVIKDIKEKLEKSSVVILTDYKGMTMSQLSVLRKKMRPIDAEYKILKNTLISLALKDKPFEGIDKLLTGPTAVLFGYKDQVMPTKVLTEFMKGNEKLTIKGGILDGKLIDTKIITALSKLPSREVLISKVLGGMKAPITNLVYDLKGILSKFVYALSAIKDKKQG